VLFEGSGMQHHHRYLLGLRSLDNTLLQTWGQGMSDNDSVQSASIDGVDCAGSRPGRNHFIAGAGKHKISNS